MISITKRFFSPFKWTGAWVYWYRAGRKWRSGEGIYKGIHPDIDANQAISGGITLIEAKNISSWPCISSNSFINWVYTGGYL